jgi:hypothetical protein
MTMPNDNEPNRAIGLHRVTYATIPWADHYWEARLVDGALERMTLLCDKADSDAPDDGAPVVWMKQWLSDGALAAIQRKIDEATQYVR